MKLSKSSKLLLSSVLLATMAGAQTVKQEGQALPKPAQKQTAPNAGINCAKGAGNAVLATAIGTAIGCVIDLFVSGGMLCTAYVTTAVANVPIAAGAGCVVGAVATPTAGTAVGNVTAPHVVLDTASDSTVAALPTN